MTPGLKLLLVEDDDTSAEFLAQALALLPAQVERAASIQQAREIASRARHALWLVDAHLPDGDGLACLRMLRELGEAPALAITAGAPAAELDALCAGGFVEVLMKPVSIALLQSTVRRLLGIDAAPGAEALASATPGGKQPVWEQERALAAIGGNAASLSRLRLLFLAELPGQCEEMQLAQERGDASAIAALVHKLRASCGFVGAARLAQAVAALQAAPLEATALRAFFFAATDTLEADAQA
jgi:DNA-binding response OmpR family regulator